MIILLRIYIFFKTEVMMTTQNTQVDYSKMEVAELKKQKSTLSRFYGDPKVMKEIELVNKMIAAKLTASQVNTNVQSAEVKSTSQGFMKKIASLIGLSNESQNNRFEEKMI